MQAMRSHEAKETGAHGAHAADAATHNATAVHKRPLLASNYAGANGKHNARQLCYQRPDRQQAPALTTVPPQFTSA